MRENITRKDYMESIGYTKCIILAWVSIPNMGDEAVA
jgi:hypothetical protein